MTVTSDKPDSSNTYPVDLLGNDQIVDTNGAGDAFAGGFLGALIAGNSLDNSVLAGHALARACVQQVRSSNGCDCINQSYKCNFGRLDLNTPGQRLIFSLEKNSNRFSNLIKDRVREDGRFVWQP